MLQGQTQIKFKIDFMKWVLCVCVCVMMVDEKWNTKSLLTKSVAINHTLNTIASAIAGIIYMNLMPKLI